ncbi:MAG: GAF domain-containing protein [Planctomycetota bacterium]|nr:GAF domain-containing protein [Planctomycetota bacterium]
MNVQIPDYEYPRPRKVDFLAALARMMDDQDVESTWAKACRQASVESDLPTHPLSELRAVANALMQMGGLAAVVGHSLLIRIVTFESLAERGTVTAPEPAPQVAERLPETEIARLEAIADLDVLATEGDDVLDELAQEAAESLGLPIALVSIITDGVQAFPAAHGIDGWIAEAGGTPKEWSFCQHAVTSGETFVVEDAASDERVQASPLVSRDGIAAYLGVPLKTTQGHVLGTLCVIGAEPRRFEAHDHERVEALARRAVEHIEARARESAP